MFSEDTQFLRSAHGEPARHMEPVSLDPIRNTKPYRSRFVRHRGDSCPGSRDLYGRDTNACTILYRIQVRQRPPKHKGRQGISAINRCLI